MDKKDINGDAFDINYFSLIHKNIYAFKHLSFKAYDSERCERWTDRERGSCLSNQLQNSSLLMQRMFPASQNWKHSLPPHCWVNAMPVFSTQC